MNTLDEREREMRDERDEARAWARKLLAERDEARAEALRDAKMEEQWRRECERHEADAARLREALRDVLPFVLCIPFDCAPGNAALAKARAALGEGTP